MYIYIIYGYVLDNTSMDLSIKWTDRQRNRSFRGLVRLSKTSNMIE